MNHQDQDLYQELYTVVLWHSIICYLAGYIIYERKERNKNELYWLWETRHDRQCKSTKVNCLRYYYCIVLLSGQTAAAAAASAATATVAHSTHPKKPLITHTVPLPGHSNEMYAIQRSVCASVIQYSTTRICNHFPVPDSGQVCYVLRASSWRGTVLQYGLYTVGASFDCSY